MACCVHELGILLEAHHGRWPALAVGRRFHVDERKGPDLLEGCALTELQRLIQVGWSIIPVEPIDANICLGGTVNDGCFSSVDDEKRNTVNDRCPNRRGKIKYCSAALFHFLFFFSKGACADQAYSEDCRGDECYGAFEDLFHHRDPIATSP